MPLTTRPSRQTKCATFSDRITVNEIECHFEYSAAERDAVWYSRRDYRSFNMAENRELLSGPSSIRVEKRKRTQRIENICSQLLEAQDIQRQKKEEKKTSDFDFSMWLADFYKCLTMKCAADARQRGIENDLELINMKLRTASSTLLKRSTIFKKLKVTNTSNRRPSRNAAWSPETKGSLKRGYLEIGEGSNVLPTARASSSKLRLELCKDLDLGNVERNSSDRWGSSVKHVKINQDFPLKPMRRLPSVHVDN